MKKILVIGAFIIIAFSAFCQRREYNILSFGAKADGQTDNAQFIQKAIDEASANGGGKVVIPADNFITGVIHLKSNVE